MQPQPGEMFTVTGVAPDVLYARVQAYQGLLVILGSEDPAQWAMFQAAYALAEVENPEDPENPIMACRYEIVFRREEVAA